MKIFFTIARMKNIVLYNTKINQSYRNKNINAHQAILNERERDETIRGGVNNPGVLTNYVYFVSGSHYDTIVRRI